MCRKAKNQICAKSFKCGYYFIYLRRNFAQKTQNDCIEESNKGHQLLKKLGWSLGSGLGAQGQGIETPLSGGDVRDRQDQYKGVGVSLNDPYENFRKNKGAAFISRMRSRDHDRKK